MSALEFPGGAMLPLGALLLLPAWRQDGVPSTLIDEQEKKLPFDMRRNCAPPLFIAVNSLE